MAIYHFSGTVISRSQGRSAIASAAYRSGEKLYDERQEQTFNYSHKQDVIFNEILLPENAPAWMTDREKLWNAVEKSETRKDSQLAREFNFALPREFSKDQNIEMVKEFLKEQFVSRGMVADVCFHAGKTQNGAEQPHAHIMLTMREVTENGFGLKDRSWNAKENLLLWRESWAEQLNKYLALNGIDRRVDHRSLSDQGLNLTPQIKLGPDNSKDYSRRLEEYQRIARENGEKLLADPAIALQYITNRQSTFTHHDIARFVNGHTADITQFQAVFEKIKVSEQIIALGKDAKNMERFTTKEMLDIEQKMLSGISSLENQGHELKKEALSFKPNNIENTGLLPDMLSNVLPNDPAGLNASGQSLANVQHIPCFNKITEETNILDRAIDGLLAMAADDPDGAVITNKPVNLQKNITVSSQQKDALEHITNPGDVKCLIGYAGTGKSHLLKVAKEAWERNGYQAHGVTLSGIAAENLEGASGIKSRTLASRCCYWDMDRQKLTDKDILVVDEAGMLGARQMARLVEETAMHGAKLVLIGDPQQLQAIEAGAAFRAICAKTNYLELTEVRRQIEPWQQMATKEFALGNIRAAFERYDQHDQVHVFETQAEAKTALVEMWNDVRIAQPDKTQIILAHTKKEVQELNEMAREYKKQNQELGEDHKLSTATGSKNFAEGDRIYFLRNNRDLSVMNGTLGTIEKIAANNLTIAIDKSSNKVAIDLACYNHITHGYAATIYKAQGVTVDRSYVLPSTYFDKHLAYVGMTRHKESANVFWSKEEFTTEKNLLSTFNRDRSKDIALDYIPEAEKNYSYGDLLFKSYREWNTEPTYGSLKELMLEAKLAKVKECTTFVDNINYYSKQDSSIENASKVEENQKSIQQLLKANNCRDLEILTYIKQQEPNLFNDINKACSNILANTLKSLTLEVKLDGVIKDCIKFVNNIDTYAKQNPENKSYLDDNIKGIQQCLKANGCRDLETLNYLKKRQPELFNNVNRVCSNILANTLKTLEGNELLTSLTQNQPDLYEKTLSSEKKYKELEQVHLNAKEAFAKMFDTSWSEASLNEPRANMNATEESLNQYASELCLDVETTRIISQHNPELFNSMNDRFDNKFIEAIKRDDLYKAHITEHPELFAQNISKEERILKTYDQYKELKQEYLAAKYEVMNRYDNLDIYGEREIDQAVAIKDEHQEILDKYTAGIYQDSDFMDYLSKNDTKEFNEMTERFNEIMREQMSELQKELERNL